MRIEYLETFVTVAQYFNHDFLLIEVQPFPIIHRAIATNCELPKPFDFTPLQIEIGQKHLGFRLKLKEIV
jgi:hypothetical protein